MKICVVCEIEKDILDFYDTGDNNEFIQPVCKRCRYDNLGPEIKSLQDQDEYYQVFHRVPMALLTIKENV